MLGFNGNGGDGWLTGKCWGLLASAGAYWQAFRVLVKVWACWQMLGIVGADRQVLGLTGKCRGLLASVGAYWYVLGVLASARAY